MTTTLYSAIEGRRSVYGINKDVKVSDEKIQEIVNFAVKHTPSSFNSQSARVVVLLNEQHNKLWDLTTETLRQIVPADQFEPTAQKMESFRSGYGTVLFFEDNAVVESLQANFATYADRFPVWSQQSNGMLQFVIWTSLEAEGLGASLQHYNPLIDEQVTKEWNIPASWQLVAQLPFGNPVGENGEKQFQALEDRVKFFN
ncbi:nitroreductase [Paenibacillus selenitireducens]|uniref:Nitroreductase n=1 Tax=Paenibacillus selenitireducens TaxID=1324314 RepID=A0A1T2XEU1_9BACL|nr:nitroreductase family protein [Paenibacillus selenitireducens]OPA78348.1 nitroreductase [Paenibacillus selenitireducens]